MFYLMVIFIGVECYNEWEIIFEEIYCNGDIVFVIYNYMCYIGDILYVLYEGSKVLMEIFCFWVDWVYFSKCN